MGGDGRMVGSTKDELLGYLLLAEGWDGERAAVPSRSSVADALVFIDGSGRSDDLEPSLHVDGTVILETETTSYRFPGDGSVVWASDVAHGTSDLSSATGGRTCP